MGDYHLLSYNYVEIYSKIFSSINWALSANLPIMLYLPSIIDNSDYVYPYFMLWFMIFHKNIVPFHKPPSPYMTRLNFIVWNMNGVLFKKKVNIHWRKKWILEYKILKGEIPWTWDVVSQIFLSIRLKANWKWFD